MESAVTSCCFCFLLLSVFNCDGFNVLGLSGPLTVQLGGSVMLPCFVETPLPMEELEVEWKRNDSGSLVHLWQEGESRPESQDQRYHERANFFSEEIKHGNFSLLLTNVTRDDAGVYKCVVYTNQESDETMIEIKEIERFIVSGDTNISANIGEDITLTCSVDSHIPAENIEEISWKKLEDKDILVLLYQDGEVLTDSSHERYMDRVEFFSAEERNKGNFSMKLKNVRTEDIGLYICDAFSGELSAKTKVEVVLGFSPMHIAISFLCTLCVFGLLILSFQSFTSLKSNDNRRPRPIHLAHVLFPNITMSIAFILWGIDDGFLPEAATCLALNLLRILCLFWIAPYLKRGKFKGSLRSSTIPLEYNMIIVVAYSTFLMNTAHEVVFPTRVLCMSLLILGSFLNVMYIPIFARIAGHDEMNWAFLDTEVINLECILAIILMYKELFVIIPMGILLVLLFILPYLGEYIWKKHNFYYKVKSLRGTSVLLIFQLLYALGSFYTHYELVDIEKERGALYCVITFVHILSVMTAFKHPHNISESDSVNPGRIHSLSCLVVYMLGTVLVVTVNAVALLVKVILKAQNGQSSVNLRVILLLTESVFAMCCLALQIPPFWNWIQKRTSGTQSGCKFCCCKQTSQDSPPQNHEQELQTMVSAPQLSGS